MARPRHPPSQTIVIKLGTSSIVHETTHQPLLSTSRGSSGAIGVGLKRMEVAHKPKSLSKKQALAAIGQGRLIALWDNLFGQVGQPIAQILLTRGDISDRTRYLNAVNTFKELLSMGVVPIVNENDTVSVSEIKFGDNDTLSAITSSMIHADYLFLMTDVDGLYTSNPRKDPNARRIDIVSSVDAIRSQVSINTLGSSLGTGGMETKLIAADIATAAGVSTIIIEYNVQLKSGANTPSSAPSTTPSLTPTSSESTSITPTPSTPRFPCGSSHSLPLARPPHTLFIPALHQTPVPAGSRESGGRLLAAALLVCGAFASGQAVRIVIRKDESSAGVRGDGTQHARDLCDGIAQFVHLSIASALEHWGTMDEEMTPSTTLKPLPEDSLVILDGATVDSADWEVEEVGRGLANYNSAQIERVKGLKSSVIPHLLGYADSEYVVENITIRISWT
ncbi:glutamate 5-kinase [Epithele typhae]|uniref:glutamate 5-kinase n=1 Tax=Epithele typhae TaxID=378194 RepID=UPI002007B734|nr:glutamate 5-kinase [Epithele typhae]KAH9918347.1 glutamate 5-kinase [Epithele typhae]